MRWFEWSRKSKERRRAKRTPMDSMAAVYWDGSVNCSHVVKDVSLTGALIDTGLNWAVGTLIRVTLHYLGKGEAGSGGKLEPVWLTNPSSEFPANGEQVRDEDVFVDVWSRVVRRTAHGLSVQFIFQDRVEAEKFRQFLESKVGEYVKESHELKAAARLQRTGAH